MHKHVGDDLMRPEIIRAKIMEGKKIIDNISIASPAEEQLGHKHNYIYDNQIEHCRCSALKAISGSVI